MVLQLKNYWHLWQRSLTFTLSLFGFRSFRISFGLWFRLIRDELIDLEAEQDPEVSHHVDASQGDHKMLIQLPRMSHLTT
jgi:hypothetical protein